MDSKRHVLREIVAMSAFVIVLFASRSVFADHYTVPSGSMKPTVHIADRVVVNKVAYGLRVPWTKTWLTGPTMPRHGDVVVLASPENGMTLLKRIVAVAGDTVTVRAGTVVIAGRELHDTFGNLDHGPGFDFGPVQVPSGHVLVLGDNRGNSHDGRAFGFVTCEALLGRAAGVYWRDGSAAWVDL